MTFSQIAEFLGFVTLCFGMIAAIYKFYEYLNRDNVKVLLILKNAYKIVPLENELPNKSIYPRVAFGFSIVNDAKREVSIRRAYLELDRKLKQDQIFRGLFRYHFNFKEKGLNHELNS